MQNNKDDRLLNIRIKNRKSVGVIILKKVSMI